MPLAKCPRCEKLFDKSSTAVCLSCAPAEDADYEKVRESLRGSPELHADAISELTGVDVKCVLRMVEQGIVASSASVANTKCGRCGAPAISVAKKLCNKCLEDLNHQMVQQRNQLKAAPRKAVSDGQHMSVRHALEVRHDEGR